MRSSAERVLTTHVGSLARTRALLETMGEEEHRRPHDAALFAEQVRDAVRDRVRRQVEVGLDVVTDGEQGKASFFTYVVERLDGFSADDGEPVLPPSWRREIEAFPDFYDRYLGKCSDTVVPLAAVGCTGPVSYRGHDAVATDVANLDLAFIAPYMLRINAGAYSFEASNPRHWHEWRIWADLALPDDKVLIPGFLGHATPYVEHPELIADGIVNYAGLVGRERVIAGADCGFSSRATFEPEIPDQVVWEKFRALVEGARRASARLWP